MLNKMLALASCLILLVIVFAVVRAADSITSIAASAPVPAPIQAVMTPYLQIHDALAKDSMDGISAAASALGKAAQGDKIFPGELVKEAQTLSLAKDLGTARASFKSLSETLIKVLSDNHLKSGAYVEAFCPMENAHWLQTGTTVSNPFGASMATCGSIVSGKAEPAATACPMSGGCCN